MRLLSVLFLICFLFSLPLHAQDHAQTFNVKCTKTGKTESFCSCTLNAFSDHMRKQNSRKLEENKMHLKLSTESILTDPVMTQSKINDVCNLYDEAQNYAFKEALVRREQGQEQARQWTDKKLAAMKQKEDLVMSYGASRETNAALAAGDYCKLNYEVNQMAQDLSESEDVIYAQVRRMIEADIGVSPFLRSGYKAGCK